MNLFNNVVIIYMQVDPVISLKYYFRKTVTAFRGINIYEYKII